MGPGLVEAAIRYLTDAWRVVYAVEIAGRLWVVHAFRKKSKTGIGTPKAEIDLVASPLARLGRELKP
ncbi:MAG: type II toxin-antitoxin system RelE/ParE family toxin [Alphaproteobacteria bacterium]|nr:type II toxin-antitoxin system RelE/ParE family toxin [Alphaproteobacteria bacterium]